VKRLLDIITALLIMAVLFLPMVLIALLIRISMGSPIFFVQERPGLHGVLFKMYKFRSMTNETDKDGNHLADGRRLTRLGRFLRSWSLDELPEFFNVLKGEMSLVGPRPQLKEYYELMNDHQRRRYEVLPGVTGLAQIKGRNGITWNERFEIDVWYVDHRSLWLDLKILLLTPYKVLKREGISAPGEVTMSKFRGNIPSVDEEV